ncbi:putative metal ion transporter [Venturia inaequalis]|nr:putative metal ion transporter [Venturia inaequalis]
MVREIKGKGTDNPYKKSRLVVQGFNNIGKEFILC